MLDLDNGYDYLLERVFHLAVCCEGVFLYKGKDAVIIYQRRHLWISSPFLCYGSSQCVVFLS